MEDLENAKNGIKGHKFNKVKLNKETIVINMTLTMGNQSANEVNDRNQ